MTQSPKLPTAILMALDANNGMVEGTEILVLQTGSINSKFRILQLVNQLALEGEIMIHRSSGGRGRKTIYKRNRNSPGAPRKVRRHE